MDQREDRHEFEQVQAQALRAYHDRVKRTMTADEAAVYDKYTAACAKLNTSEAQVTLLFTIPSLYFLWTALGILESYLNSRTDPSLDEFRRAAELTRTEFAAILTSAEPDFGVYGPLGFNETRESDG